MKQIINLISSSRTTVVLLIILTIAMGLATFIEDKYDTITARHYIYNAKWFEFLLLLLALNFIGHINKYRMFSMERLGGIIFHLSFVVMIIGAGITRYFGFEGTMHIREGQTTNLIYSSDPYLLISFSDKLHQFNYDFPVNFSPSVDKKFHVNIPSSVRGDIKIDYKNYIKNAVEKLEENVAGGQDIIELTAATQNGYENLRVEKGSHKHIGNLHISFNNNSEAGAINIIEQNGVLKISSPSEMIQTTTSGTDAVNIAKDSLAEFKENMVYSTMNEMFLFTKYFRNADVKLVSGTAEENGIDALFLEIMCEGKKYETVVRGGMNFVAVMQDHVLDDDLMINFGYGVKPTELPFSLTLRKFILERYSGSESPSSFASEVTLSDKRNNLKEDHRIFMNNVLDYDKYRFFQSSYDQDEKGTVLSVNHDFWGTWISYFGYALMTIGFMITLFNKRSRFLFLRWNIKETRKQRKAIAFFFAVVLSVTGIAYSQTAVQKPVDAEHAMKLGQLLTQSADGRFEPVYSLAYDVMHKLSKKDKFNVEGKGKMDAMQVFADFHADPEFWKQQKIIYIREQSLRDIIGISGSNASFNDFIDTESQYKLREFAEKAFRKKQAEQNNFDKDIIRVDERVNVFLMAVQGSMLRIFPEQGSANDRWITCTDNIAFTPLRGAISVINEDLQLGTLSYGNIFQAYILEVRAAIKSGDYSRADKILGYISSIQRQSVNKASLPSDKKIKMEIFYTKAQIFTVLKNVYGVLSVLLLILAFIENMKAGKNKFLNSSLNFLTLILGLAFLYHTSGMIMRWYLLGHAPWSNGYEALILIAWGALLAGFSFVKYSRITLAATALLAFFTMMTAGHSNYDPQLTNLQPVLKSYWLIIHVAVLTVSYGFLGLGFMLGLMNLIILLFKNKNNHQRLNLLVTEHTNIIEMNLTLGLFMATLGTFLGAVWANESWGRYWGWDAKETWALVIVVAYTLILHLRLVPGLKGNYSFNVGSVIGFGSVLMTFFGVNYYLSKGLHSYASGSTPVFPLWAWISIVSILLLILISGWRDYSFNKRNPGSEIL